MTKIEQNILVFIQLFVILLGGYNLIGWLLSNPAMVRIIPGSAVMVLNTALCFMVSGIWLTLKLAHPSAMPPASRWAANTAVLFVVMLPAVVLAQIVLGVDFHIDLTAMHGQVLDRNPTPGRMAPNTCVGFITIGVAFWLSNLRRTRLQRYTMYALGGWVFFLGMSSLLAYVLDLDTLYYFAIANRMAIATAIGLTFLSIGIVVLGQDPTPSVDTRQDIRLTRTAAIIMILLALTSGLAGFTVLKQGTESYLQNNLLQKMQNGVEQMNAVFDRQILMRDSLLSFPVFEKDLVVLPEHPEDVASREHLAKVVKILFNLSFSAVALKNLHGDVVYSEGALLTDTDQSFPIKVKDEFLQLFWKDGFWLHSEKTIRKNGEAIGTFITEQKMTAFDRMFRQLRTAGATTDAAMCHRKGDEFECYPSRFIAQRAHAPMFKEGAPAYPMSHALLGETGTIYANDIRGIPVMAAYGPVGDSGLGFVVKIETVEFYSFVRERLHILLGVLLFLVVCGITLLRSQMQPIASRIVESEQVARRASELLTEDAARLNQIITVQNKIALSPLDLDASLRAAVLNVQSLTNSSGTVVELIDGEELFYRSACGAFENFTGMRLKIAGSLSGHCIHERAIMRCDDAELDYRADKKTCHLLNIRSMIVAPLLHDGDVIGVLKTASSEPHAFNNKDEQSLQLLSNMIGSMISNQQAFDDKQKLLGERTVALAELERTSDILRMSEERTRIIIESAYDAFVAMDSLGRITDLNRQAERIFGWSRNQVVGKNIADILVAPNSRPIFTTKFNQLLQLNYKPEENERFEIGVLRYSGDEFVVEMAMSPLRTASGVIIAAFLHDITERRQHQEKLTQLAQYDMLTGLPNRALFMDRLRLAALRVERNQRPLALMFLDLDGFKKINDNYGHQAGDALLKLFADRLTEVVRKTDTVARLAGDEFMIILENLGEAEKETVMLANKIITSMTEPFNITGERMVVTTSIGITLAKRGNTNIDELIKQADAEMYKAKHKGKNQFSLLG